jgi:protein TonB
MMTTNVLLRSALAAASLLQNQAAAQGEGEAQGGATVQDSPPPIVSVPSPPPPTFRMVPAPPPGPPPPLPVIADPPRAKTPLQALISLDDYPMSALARREQGRVEFRLDIGANGRVLGCAITRSSGSTALDSTTCRILRSRARYTPARDSNGMPVGYPVEDAVEWRLPEKDGERG